MGHEEGSGSCGRGIVRRSRRTPRWSAEFLRWATHRLYNELARAYDAASWVVSLGRWSTWRRLALNYLPDGPILEIGFGTGELLIEMRRRQMDAYGLDLSPAMHRITRRKMRRRGVDGPLVQADAREMPFADCSFAAVVSTFPAEYVLSPATQREVARVLASGGQHASSKHGRFVVAGLYVESDSPFLKLMARLINGGDTTAAVAGFREAATAAGFDIGVAIERGKGFRLPVFILTKPGGDGCAAGSGALRD